MMFRVPRLSHQVIYARVRSNSESSVAQAHNLQTIHIKLYSLVWWW